MPLNIDRQALAWVHYIWEDYFEKNKIASEEFQIQMHIFL